MRLRYLTGVILILLGLGLFLERFDFFNFWGLIGTWWPLVIIGVGVVNLAYNRGSLFSGIFILIVGILLQASQLDMIPGGFWGAFWPLMLIMCGIWILATKIRHNKKVALEEDNIDIFVAFSGTKQNINSKNFKGGTITAMFGGVELDLRGAEITANGALLDITCMFGGVEIRVPEHWIVKSSGLPLLGGFDNKTRLNFNPNEIAPILNVRYFAMFGGASVKS